MEAIKEREKEAQWEGVGDLRGKSISNGRNDK